MSDEGKDSPNVLRQVSDVQLQYAQHHRVAYPEETLKAIALIAKSLPYVSGDAYETALDLLDESGAEVKTRRLIENNDVLLVGLRDLAEVVTRKTGRTLDDFIQ